MRDSAARGDGAAGARGWWRWIRALVPTPHFMGVASIDTWWRLLRMSGARPSPAFWPKTVAMLWPSVVSTLITLPERLVLGPLSRSKLRGVDVVVVTGYFRSGTTHLQYLLSCDPMFRTPRWVEAVTPRGGPVSWFVLKWVLTPFMSNTRPQDDVMFGPDYPAEDDFAACNAELASCLPGRFVAPKLFDHFQRFHFLEGLTAAERERWRRATATFCWKVMLLPGIVGAMTGRRRVLLLKSPSHTARVRELRELFGPERVRFVHIERDRDAVQRSNERLFDRLEVYHIQEPAEPAVSAARIADEMARTSAAFEAQAADLPADRLVRMRYEDVVADPMGQLARAYGQLGLSFTEGARRRVARYLEATQGYRTADQRASGRPKPAADRASPVATARGIVVAFLTAALLAVAWTALAEATGNRRDPLAWPLGLITGIASLYAARRGSVALGVGAVLATLSANAYAAYHLPELVHGWVGDSRWENIRTTYLGGFGFNLNTIATVLGLVSAWRYATRRQLRPPGM